MHGQTTAQRARDPRRSRAFGDSAARESCRQKELPPEGAAPSDQKQEIDMHSTVLTRIACQQFCTASVEADVFAWTCTSYTAY